MPKPANHISKDKADLALLKRAVLEAGKIALRYFGHAALKSWDKTIDHPVTDADIAVNDYLKSTLMAGREDYGWLSEETIDDASRLRAKRTFVIDPIDGTRAFIDGRPSFTICAAVTENGIARAGVVFNPVKGELFEAALGGGAFLNGAPIAPTRRKQIENCTMIGYPRKFRRLGWPDMNVSVRNSMAYRIVLVAAGQFDACVALTPKSDWDLAAAALIASEAGAVITDLNGNAFKFNSASTSNDGVICAGPMLYALLQERITTDRAAKKSAAFHSQLETKMSDRNPAKEKPEQLLHLVLGGELVDPMRTEFIDLKKVEFVGAYPNYQQAHDAWKSAAQTTVDNAHMRFFILHAHELIDPDNDGIIG